MGDASHTEELPALGSGGSFKSSVPMSQMGTQTTGRKGLWGQAVVVASPHYSCPPAGLLGALSRGHPASCPQDPLWGQAGPRAQGMQLARMVWKSLGSLDLCHRTAFPTQPS